MNLDEVEILYKDLVKLHKSIAKILPQMQQFADESEKVYNIHKGRTQTLADLTEMLKRSSILFTAKMIAIHLKTMMTLLDTAKEEIADAIIKHPKRR